MSSKQKKKIGKVIIKKTHDNKTYVDFVTAEGRLVDAELQIFGFALFVHQLSLVLLTFIAKLQKHQNKEI